MDGRDGDTRPGPSVRGRPHVAVVGVVAGRAARPGVEFLTPRRPVAVAETVDLVQVAYRGRAVAGVAVPGPRPGAGDAALGRDRRPARPALARVVHPAYPVGLAFRPDGRAGLRPLPPGLFSRPVGHPVETVRLVFPGGGSGRDGRVSKVWARQTTTFDRPVDKNSLPMVLGPCDGPGRRDRPPGGAGLFRPLAGLGDRRTARETDDGKRRPRRLTRHQGRREAFGAAARPKIRRVTGPSETRPEAERPAVRGRPVRLERGGHTRRAEVRRPRVPLGAVQEGESGAGLAAARPATHHDEDGAAAPDVPPPPGRVDAGRPRTAPRDTGPTPAATRRAETGTPAALHRRHWGFTGDAAF